MDTPEQDLAKQELDQISDKCLKILELLYQIAIIIIPTIIGLWGFIGIIATSIFFNLNPLFIPLIVYIGVFVTIFLIYLWRIRVHDLFKEERSTILRKSHLRQKIRYNGRYPSEIENDTLYEIKSMLRSKFPVKVDFLKVSIFSLFKDRKTAEYPEEIKFAIKRLLEKVNINSENYYFNNLTPDDDVDKIPDIYKKDSEIGLKFSNSGFQEMDRLSQFSIVICLIFGTIFLTFGIYESISQLIYGLNPSLVFHPDLLFSVLISKYYQAASLLILCEVVFWICSTSLLNWFSKKYIIKIQYLTDGVTAYEDEIRNYIKILEKDIDSKKMVKIPTRIH
jgi:hypothetical protein